MNGSMRTSVWKIKLNRLVLRLQTSCVEAPFSHGKSMSAQCPLRLGGLGQWTECGLCSWFAVLDFAFSTIEWNQSLKKTYDWA